MKSATNSPRVMVFLLLLVMTGAAFALGIGVMGLMDDESPTFVRNGRGGEPVQVAAATERLTDRDSRFALLDEIYEILDREFVEPDRVDLEGIKRSAINGIVQGLNDPHTVYLDPETFRLSSEDISGEFNGIGATVSLAGDAITISGTFRGSPAEASGMRSGDVILEVDGEPTASWSLQLAVSRIRGERGTPVEILVEHRNGEQELLRIIRDRIIVPSVQSIQIADRAGQPVNDIAYLIITQFTNDTRQELLEFLDAIEDAGLEQLIVDLRGNPGGLLRATVEVTGEFVDQGVILTEVHRDGSTEEFSDESGGAALGLEVVLLVDGGSASGSEVMAAALRDYGRAVIIGEQTLGKGTVNIPRRLSDESVLYVSIARWLTPNGELIEGIGVIPDIVVEPSDSDFEARLDVVLFAAIDYLRGQRNSATSAG